MPAEPRMQLGFRGTGPDRASTPGSSAAGN